MALAISPSKQIKRMQRRVVVGNEFILGINNSFILLNIAQLWVVRRPLIVYSNH